VGDRRRDNQGMSSSFLWPSEDGWPYPDAEEEVVDLTDEVDIDVLSVKVGSSHLFDDLSPVERRMVAGRYGLDGPARSMKELHQELGLPREDLRLALGSGLAKLRIRLGG